MTIRLDGKQLREKVLAEIHAELEANQALNKAKLAIILVGENPASLSYIRAKRKAAQKAGMLTELFNYSTEVSLEDIVKKIQDLNQDEKVHGILVQLPLPNHLDNSKVLQAIDPAKDVDGFHAINLGKMFLGVEHEDLVPCTPKGVIRILEEYNIPISGQKITVIGRSNLVGKPLATMLINRGATLTSCNSKTKNLQEHTQAADIVISATGQPNMLKADMFHQDSVVIDVGCTEFEGKLCGDVDYNDLDGKVAYLSPVPGGVGPMTVASLITNTYLAFSRFSGTINGYAKNKKNI